MAAWLAVNRLSFGPRAGDAARVDGMGVDNFIDEQLALGFGADEGEDLKRRLAGFDVLNATPAELYDKYERSRRDIVLQMSGAALLRAVYSKRQLYEVMVDFWTNHFNIYISKNNVSFLKPTDDREVIRPHALGRFRDLLGASASSPAMLMYLDNQANRKGHPDENYARELLELHTLGVDGGYSEQDVRELSRVLTGWGIVNVGAVGLMAGEAGDFRFNPRQHDDGDKSVLGIKISGKGGIKEIEQVLDVLASHPGTARFVASKMARRFISDTPPESVIAKGAAVFTASKGDIKLTLAAILHSPEFKASGGQKIKRPLELIAGAARALNAEVEPTPAIAEYFRQMGQPLFLWSPPNGFPDVGSAWIESSSLLARWNFAFEVATGTLKGFKSATPVPGSDAINSLAGQLLNLNPPAAVRARLLPFVETSKLPLLTGLMLAGPAYQTRG